MHRSHLLSSATTLLLAMTLTACGSDDPDQSGTDEAPPGQTTDTGEETGGAATGPGPVLSTADTALGPILVDGEGRTLYLFTQDSPSTSVCHDDCLAAWPVLEGEPTAGDGVDDSLLGSFEREDGTAQATYDGWPLYYFAQDQAPGDVTGQAVNDVWWVIDADGAAVTEAPEESDDGGGLGY